MMNRYRFLPLVWLYLLLSGPIQSWASPPKRMARVSPVLIKKVAAILDYKLAGVMSSLKKTASSQSLALALREIAFNPRQQLIRRSRAITALVYSPCDIARNTYQTLLGQAKLSAFLKRKTLEAMAYVFKQEALGPALTQLSASDTPLREAALRVIRRYPHAKSLPALRLQMRREKSAYLQTILAKTLQIIRLRVQVQPSSHPVLTPAPLRQSSQPRLYSLPPKRKK